MAPPTSGSATAAAAGGLEGRKRYVVLAALMGTLVMIAIVSSVSVVLSPAHIFFYITNATEDTSTSTRNNIMNVTFVANNTSHHAEVKYHSINIEMWFGSNNRARLDNFRGSWGGWQKPREALVNWASGPLTYYYSGRNGTEDDDYDNDYDSDGYPMVVIKTRVQFRYGHSRTRLYSIAVSCPSVRYGDGRNSTTPPVNCTA